MDHLLRFVQYYAGLSDNGLAICISEAENNAALQKKGHGKNPAAKQRSIYVPEERRTASQKEGHGKNPVAEQRISLHFQKKGHQRQGE